MIHGHVITPNCRFLRIRLQYAKMDWMSVAIRLTTFVTTVNTDPARAASCVRMYLSTMHVSSMVPPRFFTMHTFLKYGYLRLGSRGPSQYNDIKINCNLQSAMDDLFWLKYWLLLSSDLQSYIAFMFLIAIRILPPVSDLQSLLYFNRTLVANQKLIGSILIYKQFS